MTTLRFICDSDEHGLKTELAVTLEGENIDHYISAFRRFLLALEFHPDVIEEHLNAGD